MKYFVKKFAHSEGVAVYLIFRFITGFSGSAFLSVAGGSVSDLFDNAKVATYVISYVSKLLLITHL